MAPTTTVWLMAIILLQSLYVTESEFVAKPYNLTYIEDPEMRQLVWTHLEWCGSEYVCNTDLLNITRYSGITCSPCDCDEECATRQTCCPDMYEMLEPLSNSTTGTGGADTYECVFVAVPFQNFSSLQVLTPKRLISCCPENMSMADTSNELVQLCHQDYTTLWTEGLEDYAIPVTERANTSNNYKNVYCALCHGLDKSNLIYWTITIGSYSSLSTPVAQNVFHDRNSFLHALKRVLFRNIYTIFVLFVPPTNVSSSDIECRINTCNKSGLWINYDEFTERACHLYNTGFLNDTFANVFCALCNNLADFYHMLNGFDFPASYLALVDINELDPRGSRLSYDTGEGHNCELGYWYDPIYEKCRQLHCSLLFYLHNNKCRLAYKNLHDFQYIVVQQYRLRDPKTLTQASFERMNNTVHRQLLDYLQDLYYTTGYDLTLWGLRIDHLVNMVYDWMGGKPELLDLKLLYVQISIVVKFDMTTLTPWQTLEGMIETVEKLWNINFYPRHLVKQNFPSKTEYFTEFEEYSPLFSTLESQLETYAKSHDAAEDFNFMLPWYTDSTTPARTTTPGRRQERSADPSQAEQQSQQYSTLFFALNVFPAQKPISEGAVLIQPSHTCVKVMLDKEDFVQNSSGIFLGALNLFIPLQPRVDKKVAEISANQTSPGVGVCLSDYQAAIRAHRLRITSFHYSTETLLSLACSSISTLSLITTITVYTTIRELRTIPGLLITRTCLSLLVTQLIYVVTNSVHVGGVAWLCAALGVLLHLSSLAYLFWMNVGTLHMLKAFTSCTPPSRNNRLPWRYTLTVHALSVAFVLVNIATRLVVTRSLDIGYGGDICYINNSLMIGVTFVLPLSFVVVTNTVMFILAIRSVVMADDITTTSNRKYILIFTKLSTLTGITWVFGLVYQWSQLGVIAYIFIVLNASQGVFILVSFVFNRRIYRIVKKLTTTTNITQ